MFRVRSVLIAVVALVFMGGGAFAATPKAPAAASASASASAAAAPAGPTEFWTVRCGKPDDSKKADKKAPDPTKQCEVFQRLSVKKTNQRVAEFAVGFPGKDHDVARGVVVLPLGILLTDDLNMQIDDGMKFKFKARYCTGEGCFAFIDLNKTVLEALRNGKAISITGKAYTGQDLSIKMQLDGFDKALKKL